jgi:hypothetical protein
MLDPQRKSRMSTTQQSTSPLIDIVQSLTEGKAFAFVIMPFGSKGAIFDAVANVVREVLPDFMCIHAGMVQASGFDLLSKIRHLIARADFVIAEISEPRPNVFFELGYADALDKNPILLLDQSSAPPTDLLGLEVLRYSQQVGPFDTFKEQLRETLRRRLNTNRALLWDMLEPEARRPVFILSSPKSPQRGSPDDPGLYDERTFGDYLGIVGLLSAFGSFSGEHGNVELISAQLYPKDLLASRPVSLFLIGSPKSNRATGVMLTVLQKQWEPKWRLVPQGDVPAKGNYAVVLQRVANGRTIQYERQEYPSVGRRGKIKSEDYGLIIRAPHPKHQDRLVMIMAGPRSLGTGAACLAATRSPLIARIQERLPKGIKIADKHQAFWVLVKGSMTDKRRLLDLDGVTIEEAGIFKASL